MNAIINYLEIALEGHLDNETRENLARSHDASKSLIYVINDLLDLTRTEEGHDLLKDEVFDIREVIGEVATKFKRDAERKKLDFGVVEYPGLPPLVKGDSSRLRQVLSNVVANAIKYTTKGGIKIEIWTSGDIKEGGKWQIEIAVEDTGCGLSSGKLDILFGEFEQIQTEEESHTTAQEESATFNALAKIPGQKILGLGLAVVARGVRNMGGQLRLKSEEGKGSRFTICVPFLLPPDYIFDTPSLGPQFKPMSGVTPKKAEGEVTLIRPSSRDPQLSMPIIEGASTLGSHSDIDKVLGIISSPSASTSTANEYFAARPGTTNYFPHSVRPSLTHRGSGSSFGTPIFERLNPNPNTPGQEILPGSVAPLRPVRLMYDGIPVPSGAVVPLPPRLQPIPQEPETVDPSKLKILVAEDDMINSKIIKKRLEKMGHKVVLTANGEECLEKFVTSCAEYNAVLMDMQVGYVRVLIWSLYVLTRFPDANHGWWDKCHSDTRI